MAEKKYTGEERRVGYCAVHNIKCDEIKSIQSDAKRKTPIWVFTLFVSVFLIVIGWFNLQSNNRNEDVLKSLEKHLVQSDLMFSKNGAVLTRVAHALNEVAFNQRSVMKKIELEFQPIPDYDAE